MIRKYNVIHKSAPSLLNLTTALSKKLISLIYECHKQFIVSIPGVKVKVLRDSPNIFPTTFKNWCLQIIKVITFRRLSNSGIGSKLNLKIKKTWNSLTGPSTGFTSWLTVNVFSFNYHMSIFYDGYYDLQSCTRSFDILT